MRSAGIFEAKQHFSEIVGAVEPGEEVRITRHGKEIARMVPVTTSGRPAPSPSSQADAALAALRRLRAGVKPGPGWRDLRDEGRRE